MRIFPSDHNSIIIQTMAGSIHVYDKDASESGEVEVHYYDHFSMKIKGTHKHRPTVIIDSDEYPTRLKIEETESKWIRMEEK